MKNYGVLAFVPSLDHIEVTDKVVENVLKEQYPQQKIESELFKNTKSWMMDYAKNKDFKIKFIYMNFDNEGKNTLLDFLDIANIGYIVYEPIMFED